MHVYKLPCLFYQVYPNQIYGTQTWEELAEINCAENKNSIQNAF